MGKNNLKAVSFVFSPCGIGTATFVLLKACGFVEWPWWAVLAPLWLPFAMAGVMLGILGLVVVLCMVFRSASGNWNRV